MPSSHQTSTGNRLLRNVILRGTAVAAIILGLAWAQPARAQANVNGTWQTLPTTMPINPVHIALMHNGKLLVVSGSGNVANNPNWMAAVWDPATGTVSTMSVDFDMFCNGMIVLPDGRPFVMGGTLQYDPFHGELKTAVFDPSSGAFADQQSMAHGRWYPTATVLGDGRIMIFSGLDENGSTNTNVEFYTVGTGWSQVFGAPWTPPLYPRMHLLPNGKVFYSGSTTGSSLFDPSTHTWTVNIATTNFGGTRTYGTSVLLPLTPANGYKPRVMILGGGSPATKTTESIDLSAANPKWVTGTPMTEARIEMNATLLPSGQLLATGGSVNDEDSSTASLNADLFDTNTGARSSAGSNVFARLYHSNSILLPDATVLLIGGNPSRGTYESHMEIYSPAYLYDSNGTLATRPTISSVTAGPLPYASGFQVQTPDAANISSVVLMKAGAVTHAFDMEQRLVGLNFTAGSGVLNVTSPPNGNIAPPGYYMLFILNSSGVPSVAQFVQLSTVTDESPTGTITSPASNVSILAGQSVNFAGSGADPDGSITSYAWTFPGGNPASSALANPGNVTYATPGTYVASLTVTDSGGRTDPNPPTRTVTVSPAFTLSASPASQTVAAAATANYTVSVNPGSGFTGTVGFGASGLPSGATPSFSPSTVTTSGSTTMSIATTSSTPTGTYTVTITGTSGVATASTSVTLIVTGGTSGGPTGLVAAYNFNEGSGTTVGDSSGNNNTGTITNATWTTNGKFGSALVFNGSSSLINIADSGSLNLTSGMTIEAWVNPVGVSGWTDVVYKGVDRYYLEAGSYPSNAPAAGMTLTTGNQNVFGTAALAAGAWTHLAETYDGSTLRLYVNGVQVSSLAVSGTLTTSGNALQIGGDSAYGQHFNGTIDEIRIYNQALTQAQVQSDMSTSIGGFTDTTPPTAPTNLTATAVSTSQINLSWTASTDPDSAVSNYLVERCVTSSCTFAQVGTSTSTTFSDTGLAAGTGYSYRVRASDPSNNLSSYSSVATATTQAPDTTPPTAPTNLTATAVSSSQINLSWTASTDPDSAVSNYLVERCVTSSCTFAQVGTSTSTTFSDSGLTALTSYSYRVRATDPVGNLSGYSNTTNATTSNTPAPPTGLVAAYNFNEGSGTTVGDSSGNNNTGTITNATWTTNGKFGSALVFNGSSSLINIADSGSLNLTSGMTIEAWVNPVGVSGWTDVVYKGVDRYYLEAGSYPSNAPAAGGTMTTGNQNVYGTGALAAGTWTHLAETYDGSTLRLYVNGVQVSSLAVSGTLTTSGNALQIGGDSAYGQHFNGTIDEIRIYNQALTQAQIQADMNAPL